MSDLRDEERRAEDERRWGRCPVCDEVLAHDGEEDLTFCPNEEERHPQWPSRLAVQAITPNAEAERFLIGATSVDGRSSSLELQLVTPATSTPGVTGLATDELAERLGRALLAAGARRGTFRFGPEGLDASGLDATFARLRSEGFASFSV